MLVEKVVGHAELTVGASQSRSRSHLMLQAMLVEKIVGHAELTARVS